VFKAVVRKIPSFMKAEQFHQGLTLKLDLPLVGYRFHRPQGLM
jgi:hypothetical protein